MRKAQLFFTLDGIEKRRDMFPVGGILICIASIGHLLHQNTCGEFVISAQSNLSWQLFGLVKIKLQALAERSCIHRYYALVALTTFRFNSNGKSSRTQKILQAGVILRSLQITADDAAQFGA